MVGVKGSALGRIDEGGVVEARGAKRVHHNVGAVVGEEARIVPIEVLAPYNDHVGRVLQHMRQMGQDS